MAISTLVAESIILYDNFPGTVSPAHSVPEGGDFGFFNGSRHHNVSSAVYRVGEKIRIYNDPTTGAGLGENGWSTMIYLRMDNQDTTIISAGSVCTLQTTIDANEKWFTVTNDPDSGLAGYTTGALVNLSPAAVAISAMTDEYYGWFWCGGVAPQNWLLATATTTSLVNVDTDTSVIAGPIAATDSGEIVAFSKALDTQTHLNLVAGLAYVADA